MPGTTGDEVCRKLLDHDETARIPVVVCSAMRNRAFAQYTEFANVVDQIPKPFTPELLKSGVSNALATGSMVVQAQRTGCAMPEAVGEVQQATLEGTTEVFPLRAVLDFLNNGQHSGRLTLELGNDRIRFAISGGRVQAVYSPTIAPDRLIDALPVELGELAPLLALTLGEHQDASMSGLVKMLERSLSDPRRLRSLLRFQSAMLTHWGMTGSRLRPTARDPAPSPCTSTDRPASVTEAVSSSRSSRARPRASKPGPRLAEVAGTSTRTGPSTKVTAGPLPPPPGRRRRR